MLPLSGDKRRHQRKICIIPFVYGVPPDSSGVQIGVTANISDSGMCIYSDSNHGEGEVMEIRSPLPVPYTRASIRWTKKDAADLYKMGLMFID
jgi:hypothetical protein